MNFKGFSGLIMVYWRAKWCFKEARLILRFSQKKKPNSLVGSDGLHVIIIFFMSICVFHNGNCLMSSQSSDKASDYEPQGQWFESEGHIIDSLFPLPLNGVNFE